MIRLEGVRVLGLIRLFAWELVVFQHLVTLFLHLVVAFLVVLVVVVSPSYRRHKGHCGAREHMGPQADRDRKS